MRYVPLACRILAVSVLLALLPACQSAPGPRKPAGNAAPSRNRKLELCGAVRGNGTSVFSTIASLASFTENYGTFDALSGASSGGIADFIYESVLLNPFLRACRDDLHPCDPVTIRKRAGLMLKSVR